MEYSFLHLQRSFEKPDSCVVCKAYITNEEKDMQYQTPVMLSMEIAFQTTEMTTSLHREPC